MNERWTTMVPTMSGNDYSIFSFFKPTGPLFRSKNCSFFDKYNDNSYKRFKFINKFPYYKVVKIRTKKIIGMISILLLQIFEIHVKREDIFQLDFFYKNYKKDLGMQGLITEIDKIREFPTITEREEKLHILIHKEKNLVGFLINGLKMMIFNEEQLFDESVEQYFPKLFLFFSDNFNLNITYYLDSILNKNKFLSFNPKNSYNLVIDIANTPLPNSENQDTCIFIYIFYPKFENNIDNWPDMFKDFEQRYFSEIGKSSITKINFPFEEKVPHIESLLILEEHLIKTAGNGNITLDDILIYLLKTSINKLKNYNIRLETFDQFVLRKSLLRLNNLMNPGKNQICGICDKPSQTFIKCDYCKSKNKNEICMNCYIILILFRGNISLNEIMAFNPICLCCQKNLEQNSCRCIAQKLYAKLNDASLMQFNNFFNLKCEFCNNIGEKSKPLFFKKIIADEKCFENFYYDCKYSNYLHPKIFMLFDNEIRKVYEASDKIQS